MPVVVPVDWSHFSRDYCSDQVMEVSCIANQVSTRVKELTTNYTVIFCQTSKIDKKTSYRLSFNRLSLNFFSFNWAKDKIANKSGNFRNTKDLAVSSSCNYPVLGGWVKIPPMTYRALGNFPIGQPLLPPAVGVWLVGVRHFVTRQSEMASIERPVFDVPSAFAVR